MNQTLYSPLIFELSHPGRKGYSLPENKWKVAHATEELPETLRRQGGLDTLPEADELTVARHYTNMSGNNFGIDTGFYPLGSCTMKYNPKINEELAALPGFTELHPDADDADVQGALELYDTLQSALAEIGGMSRFTLNPYAGAHGELTGLMVISSYHRHRGDAKRTKIIVPDSAHGTNPASAAVCGFQVVQVSSTPEGTVDVEALKPLLGDDIAGMMMTNPNTLGIFETRIPEIAKLVHDCGGLMYYDGANLNPMLGVCRPGDMGFDVMHINLHKTFSTPHGGGGPGSGPVGVRSGLEAFLPGPVVEKDSATGLYRRTANPDSLGSVSSNLGNFGILVRALAWILAMGRENLPLAAKISVLNANYVKENLRDYYALPIEGICKHEFVFDGMRAEYGGSHSDASHITTLEVAKRLLDYGFHAPTIYFPLLFHESMMIEPTESESKETLDKFIDVLKKIAIEARETPHLLRTAPQSTPVRRLDDVKAVKDARFTYTPEVN